MGGSREDGEEEGEGGREKGTFHKRPPPGYSLATRHDRHHQLSTHLLSLPTFAGFLWPRAVSSHLSRYSRFWAAPDRHSHSACPPMPSWARVTTDTSCEPFAALPALLRFQTGI